jgi:hypothetical protein
MFLPLIIAILLGLVNPANHNTNCNGGGTVYVNSDGSNSGDDGSGSGGDEGSGGDDETNPGGLPPTDGPGHGGPGGNTGQNPPKP